MQYNIDYPLYLPRDCRSDHYGLPLPWVSMDFEIVTFVCKTFLFTYISHRNNAFSFTQSVAFYGIGTRLFYVVLFFTDRQGLTENGKVEYRQDKILECLKREVDRRDWKNKQMFAKLLVQVTKLRTISTIFKNSANEFRTAWPYVELPALLQEILDYEC